jgi:transposase
MKEVTVLGIDLAKRVFQLHGINSEGKVILKKKISRTKLMPFIANFPQCLIATESCATSNYWAREFIKLGHKVKLISPQYVKPYVKTNKNDAADAEAICEAVTRPNMRFVPVKSIKSQDIQSIHRARERCIRQRTATANEIRGLLGEYGIIVPQGISKLINQLPLIIENADNLLSTCSREIFSELLAELYHQSDRIKSYDSKISALIKQNEKCQRLLNISGIGPLAATAIVANCTEPSCFKNGRDYAAYLGLVPKQHSSGGRERQLGISKRGNKFIRKLLVHDARVVIFWAKNKKDRLSRWINQLKERAGINKTAVALANKIARIAWKLLSTGESFQVA